MRTLLLEKTHHHSDEIKRPNRYSRNGLITIRMILIMKKTILVSALTLALGVITNAQAAGGTITFNGLVDASTCTAAVDGGAADATVVLPTVSTRDLATAGKTVGQTSFSIDLSECEGTLKTAAAYFEGTPSQVDLITGRLVNTGTATNASLILTNGTTGSTIVVGSASQGNDTGAFKDVSTGSVTLPHTVAYYAEGAVGAGTVTGQVNYTVIYK
jgi:major type 1 subunit fimbrin (pilin)